MPNNIIGTLLLTIILSTALLTLGLRSLYVSDIKPYVKAINHKIKNTLRRRNSRRA